MRITVTFFFSSVFLCLPLSTPTTHNTKHAETQGNGLEHNFVLYSSFFFLRQKKNKKDGSVRRKHTHTKRETSAAVLSSTDVSRGEDIVQKKKKNTQRVCGEVRCFKSPHYTIEISFAWERHTYYVAFFFSSFACLFFFFSFNIFVGFITRFKAAVHNVDRNKQKLFISF